MKRSWDEICPNNQCPISFTDEELQKHLHDGEGWNEQADFWDRLEGFVARDGWTSNENFDAARQMFADLREEGLNLLEGDDREQLETRSQWAILKNEPP